MFAHSPRTTAYHRVDNRAVVVGFTKKPGSDGQVTLIDDGLAGRHNQLNRRPAVLDVMGELYPVHGTRHLNIRKYQMMSERVSSTLRAASALQASTTRNPCSSNDRLRAAGEAPHLSVIRISGAGGVLVSVLAMNAEAAHTFLYIRSGSNYPPSKNRILMQKELSPTNHAPSNREFGLSVTQL